LFGLLLHCLLAARPVSLCCGEASVFSSLCSSLPVLTVSSSLHFPYLPPRCHEAAWEQHLSLAGEVSDGLLSLLLPAPQEVPLFGGTGWYVVPMPEPRARRQGQKAFPRPWERLSPWPGLDALPEPVALWQAQHPRQHPCRQPQVARRESTCRGLNSSACSAMSMVQQMVELIEAQKYLVP